MSLARYFIAVFFSAFIGISVYGEGLGAKLPKIYFQ